MKRYMNKVLTIAALLLLTSFGARAEQTVTIVIKPSTSAGTVSYSITNGICTLTATPASGYYLTVDNLTATTSLDGGGVQVRRKADGINVSNETLEITATDASADPSGTTKYTFAMPNDEYINVEVTAEFQTLIAISPSVSLSGWTYGSAPQVPQVSGNPGNGAVSFTYKAQGTDTFTDTPPTESGTHTIKATVAAAMKYAGGEATNTFTISKAAGSISYATATVNKTYGDAAFTNTLTKTGDGTVTYASDNESAATVDGNGEVTIKGNGEATITATVTDGTNYTYENKTASYLVSVGKAAMEVTANGYTGTYDEQAHGITVNAPDGAAVKYGTTEGTYDLDASPTYTNAGTYTVFYKVTKENFTDITGSQTVTINKAAGSISYATATVNKTYGDAAFTNALTMTGDGTVTYASDNESVATVDDNGEVTIKGNGEATITATVTDGTNYTYENKTATYTITVSRAKGEGYGLWIGDTQVTTENADDILKDATTGETSKSGSFVFNPKNNYLFINYEGKEGEDDLSIESRLPELVIYIRNEVGNKLKRIFYNNVDDSEGSEPGKLVFTTYYNVNPGKLFLANDEGESAIWGFSSVNYASELAVIEPDGICYNNQQLEWTKDVEGVEVVCPANEVTIARPLEMTKKVLVKQSDYVQRDDEGQPMTNEDLTPMIVSLRNTIINNLLHVLAKSDDPDSDEGFDDSDGVEGITVEGLMTDKKVGNVAGKVVNSDLVPGGSALAEEYNGFIFLPPAGEGTISTTLKVDPGYAFHLAMEKDIKYEKDEEGKFIINDDDKPFTVIHELSNGNNSTRSKVKKAEYKDAGNGYIEVTIDYDSPEPSYCYLYLVKTDEASGARSIVPVGKRDKAHGKVVSINVNIVKKSSGNPPYMASDGVIPNMEDPDDDDDIITGIKVINNTDNSRVGNNKWYNLNGQQIDLPTKQGLYIINGKKIIIK